jgi:nicotinamidase-related amidase
MRKILLVVDMQNDFIDGALGSEEAASIVPGVAKKISEFSGEIIFTRDTHFENYLSTAEGKKLPVKHCIKDSGGWQISSALPIPQGARIMDKETFACAELAELLKRENGDSPISEIEIVGLCTDICVISNAFLLKAYLPECEITVNSALCRGVTPQSHVNALAAMSACQINVI